MSFSVRKPYTIATLPRPIEGRYVVGDVFGGDLASKKRKRKRSELSVGVDGEGVTLYDISSSRLITSYAIPPQALFTCPPSSSRTRISKSKVERRTYISTTTSQSQVTLFYDCTDGKHGVRSSTETQKLSSSKAPVIYMETVAAPQGNETGTELLELLVVKSDGEIQCLDGNTLQERWTSPGSAIERDITASSDGFEIEYAQLSNAFAASQGVLKGRGDILALFSDDSDESKEGRLITESGFNPAVLFIVTKSTSSSTSTRNFHIITLPRKNASAFLSSRRSVTTILSTPIPNSFKQKAGPSTFSLHAPSGALQQLCHNSLITFDLSSSIPRIVSIINVERANSFQRLSSTSTMIASDDKISVYNPKYQSVIGSVTIDEKESSNEHSLVSYFAKLNVAIAITGHELVGIQIDSKSRASGLLIDLIGCSAQNQSRPVLEGSSKVDSKEVGLATMQSYLPGSIGINQAPLDVKALESAVANGDADLFDKLISKKLRINEARLALTESKKIVKENVDKRWVIFAIGNIFRWSTTDNSDHQLTIFLYPQITFMWLLKNGYLTKANIESALRPQIRDSSLDGLPAGEIVRCIAEMDRTMELLRILISQTFLDASELVSAIRTLMDSLDLFGEDAATKQGIITDGEDVEMNDAELKQREDEVEEELAMLEHQLGPRSATRGETLSAALSKLYLCPSDAIVFALQTILSSQEIVGLIYQLRFDLRGGAWTSKYIDPNDADAELDAEADMSDSSIIVIASLLHNCIDAIGAGGWISGNMKLVNGDTFEAQELIGGLLFEVSAAVETLEETQYLKGVISEMLRYSDSVGKLPSQALDVAAIDSKSFQRGEKRKATHDVKPVLVPFLDESSTMLPLGIPGGKISYAKVGIGGEVQKRSKRDIGRLRSRKVPKYSLERVVI